MKSIFPKWFSHYEDLFTINLKEQADDWKVGLLLRKLRSAELSRYSNYILPKHPQDFNFIEMVEILKQIFSECIPLFNIHFKCLNITEYDTVDFMTYADTQQRV